MKLPKLSLSAASALHGSLIAAQVLNLISGYVPAKDQFYVAGALGVVQAIVGVLQHLSPPPGSAPNPSGSSAQPQK